MIIIGPCLWINLIITPTIAEPIWLFQIEMVCIQKRIQLILYLVFDF